MKAKNGARTQAIAGVMDSPLALAACAALLSLPWMQETAFLQRGKVASMQYVSAYVLTTPKLQCAFVCPGQPMPNVLKPLHE